jgi:hypothetical protein
MLSYHHVTPKEHGRAGCMVTNKISAQGAAESQTDNTHTGMRSSHRARTKDCTKDGAKDGAKVAQKTIEDGAGTAKRITSIRNRLYRRAGA